MFIAGLGWVFIRPVEYGDILAFQQRPHTAHSLAELFSSHILGVTVGPEGVRRMDAEIPPTLEKAILEASGVDFDHTDTTDTDEADRSDYRDDSPFGTTPNKQSDEIEPADSVYWLHEQGYTYTEIYGLLLDEIRELADGFENHKEKQEKQREKQRSDQTGDAGTTPTAHGNKGDRAKQLGWR